MATRMSLHVIPGGAYTVGQPRPLAGELPEESCVLDPFLVGRFPVLQREWDSLPGEDQRAHVGSSLPVGGVSWQSAQAWLSQAGFRLPREREWEAACRGGGTSAFVWGSDVDGRAAWYLDNSGGRPRDCTLHLKHPNAFGLVDVVGNVSEWCEEDLDVPMEGSSWQEGNPGKVHRGGSYETASQCLRASFRSGTDPTKTYPDLGVRAFSSLPTA